MSSSETLKAFFQSKDIQAVLPWDPEYSALNTFYQLQDPKSHIALVRPRNEKDVVIAVQYATARKIKIVVRSGGGDLFGRSQAEGALSIDMRQINFVMIDPDRATATVGGGCVVGDIAAQLSEHGLATSLSSYTNCWIVGARVVNGNGELIDADQDMLKGIRGGGGNLGVVVQLTIKVYPLQKIQSGLIMFDSVDIASAFQSFTKAYNNLWANGVPSELGVQPVVFNMSGYGRQFGVIVVWSSPDTELGQTYLDKVATLGKETMRTVSEMTVPEWMENNSGLVPYGVYGYNTSVSVRKVTDEIAEVIGKNLAKMPSDLSTMFAWHELRGPSTNPHEDSVFGAREPHYVLELLGTVADPANLNSSNTWITAFREELRQCKDVLTGDYISLTRPSDNTLDGLYGSRLGTIYTLKDKYDPKGVFNLAVPRLYEE